MLQTNAIAAVMFNRNCVPTSFRRSRRQARRQVGWRTQSQMTRCMLTCIQAEQAARRAAESRLADAVAERTALEARLAGEAAANAQQAALLVDAQVTQVKTPDAMGPSAAAACQKSWLIQPFGGESCLIVLGLTDL